MEPAPSRWATAATTSWSVNVVEVTVRSLRSRSRDPFVGGDDPFVVLGPAVFVEADVGQSPHLVDADRAAWLQLGDQGVGLAPAPIPTPRPPASSRRRAVPLRVRACAVWLPAPPPVGLPGQSASRSPRAMPRSRPAAWRTGRPGPGGRRRSPGRAVRAATRRRGCGSARLGTLPGTPRPPPARARYRSGWANADQRPSAPSARLAISTCQCSSGSSSSAGAMPERGGHDPRRLQPVRPDPRCVLTGGDQLGPLLVDPRHVVGAALHLDRFALQPGDRLPRRRGSRRR